GRFRRVPRRIGRLEAQEHLSEAIGRADDVYEIPYQLGDFVPEIRKIVHLVEKPFLEINNRHCCRWLYRNVV
ncbi:unnamed protein product, partial [Nesidiocoris tenuis]